MAGEALSRHLNKILPALLSAVTRQIGGENEAQELAQSQEVLMSVADDDGVRFVVTELLRSLSQSEMQCAAMLLLCGYCEQTMADLTE